MNYSRPAGKAQVIYTNRQSIAEVLSSKTKTHSKTIALTSIAGSTRAGATRRATPSTHQVQKSSRRSECSCDTTIQSWRQANFSSSQNRNLNRPSTSLILMIRNLLISTVSGSRRSWTPEMEEYRPSTTEEQLQRLQRCVQSRTWTWISRRQSSHQRTVSYQTTAVVFRIRSLFNSSSCTMRLHLLPLDNTRLAAKSKSRGPKVNSRPCTQITTTLLRKTWMQSNRTRLIEYSADRDQGSVSTSLSSSWWLALGLYWWTSTTSTTKKQE